MEEVALAKVMVLAVVFGIPGVSSDTFGVVPGCTWVVVGQGTVIRVVAP